MSGKGRGGKNAASQIKAFNIAVNHYQAKGTERNLEDVDKVLTVLTQINNSEAWDVDTSEVRDLVVNSVQLIHQLDYKSGTTWSLVNLLTKVSDISTASRIRDEFFPVPVLARLLHSIPPTTHNRTAKLLELLQTLVQDIAVLRSESYMGPLITDLFHLTRGEDEKVKFLAAFILSSILRNNFLVVRSLMTSCRVEDITGMGNGQQEDFSLIIETIAFRLDQFDLTSSPPSSSVLAKILQRISSCLKQAFSQDNRLMIKFLTDFLSDISTCLKWGGALRQLNSQDHLSDILAIPQFDKLNPGLWEMYFGFLTTLVGSINGDNIIIFNKIIKVVLARLEVKPFTEVNNTLALLILSLERIVLEDLTAADKRNLKFQVDQLLPCLQTVYNSSAVDPNGRECMLTCLELLQLLTGLEQLAGAVSPDKMATTFKKGFNDASTKATLKSELAVEFLSLVHLLVSNESSSSKGWSKVKEELMSNNEVMQAVAAVLRSNEHRGCVSKKAVAIMALRPEYQFTKSPNADHQPGQTTQSQHQQRTPELADNYMSADQSLRLEQSIEQLSAAASRLTVAEEEERILPEVLQLQLYLANKEQAQIRALRGDIEAADERLRNKVWLIENLNQELKTSQHLLHLAASRYSAARAELDHIRTQHSSFSMISQTRAQELEDQLADSEQQLARHLEQAARLKDNYEQTSQELAKVKAEYEVAANDRVVQAQQIKDLKMAVSKRDDKLKRTMKQLEEEQSKREEVERKVEKLEKLNQSLETLTRNQEEAFNKKEKALEETTRQLQEMKTIRDAIFNLSKGTAGSG